MITEKKAIMERIYDATEELLRTRKVSEVTMEEIAERAGCSVNTLYNYFGSKDSLFLSTLETMDEQYLEAVQKLRKEPPYKWMTAEERLVEWLCRVIEICSEGQRMTIDYLYKIEGLDRTGEFESERRNFFLICGELLEDVKQAGLLPADCDTQELIDQILILIRGTLMEHVMEGGRLPVRDTFRMLATDMLRGYSKKAPADWPKRWREPVKK